MSSGSAMETEGSTQPTESPAVVTRGDRGQSRGDSDGAHAQQGVNGRWHDSPLLSWKQTRGSHPNPAIKFGKFNPEPQVVDSKQDGI